MKSGNAKVITHAAMYRSNVSSILRTIIKYREIARTDIADYTKMAVPTVARISKSLLGLNLLEEVYKKSNGLGRHPTLLSINPRGYYAIGIEITKELFVNAAIVNARGEVGRIIQQKLPKDWHEDFYCHIQKIIDGFSDDEKKRIFPHVLGIGISLPGLVAERRGVAYFSNADVKNISIKQGKALDPAIPAYVENDANSAALGEMYFGSNPMRQTLIYLSIGKGIGAGIIMDGSLYKGKNDAAGELGHVVMDPRGAPCLCGRRGCLETVVSTNAIIRKMDMMRKANPEYVGGKTESIDEIIELGKKGDPLVTVLMDEVFDYLEVVIGNIVNYIDIGNVILGGEFSEKSGDYLVDNLNKRLNKIKYFSNFLKLSLSALDQNPGIIGAAAVVFSKIYNDVSDDLVWERLLKKAEDE